MLPNLPKEGDVLRQPGGDREIHVDWVSDGQVYFRVTDGRGALLAARRVTLEVWDAGITDLGVEVNARYP